jgi:hypothetical protein
VDSGFFIAGSGKAFNIQVEIIDYLSLSNTFIAKFLTLKDTEDSQSPPASLTQTALQNEPLLLANQF